MAAFPFIQVYSFKYFELFLPSTSLNCFPSFLSISVTRFLMFYINLQYCTVFRWLTVKWNLKLKLRSQNQVNSVLSKSWITVLRSAKLDKNLYGFQGTVLIFEIIRLIWRATLSWCCSKNGQFVLFWCCSTDVHLVWVLLPIYIRLQFVMRTVKGLVAYEVM